MENLADISENQVPPNDQKDQLIQFSISLLIFFNHLAELWVQKYLSSFPYRHQDRPN